MPDDWTSLEYGHVKDWTPVPDSPQKYENKGLLQSAYNLLPDWLTGTGKTKEDVGGLSTQSRLANTYTRPPTAEEAIKGVKPKDSVQVTPEQEAAYYKNAEQTYKNQMNDPNPLKRAGYRALDVGSNLISGTLGNMPPPESSSPGKFANFLSQMYGADAQGLVTHAGLPWLASTEGKPMWRGAKKYFEKLDPTKYDKYDVLGHMTHMAEEGSYASSYAMGEAKHGPMNLARGDRPHVLALKADAKNVFDAVDPNADDVSQILASVPPNERRRLIRDFKSARADPDLGRKNLHPLHYPNPSEIPDNEVALRMLTDDLNLNEEQWKKTPFDAIKYRDEGRKVYAVPSETQVRSFFGGVPMTDVPKELQVTRIPEHIAPEGFGSGLMKESKPYRAGQNWKDAEPFMGHTVEVGDGPYAFQYHVTSTKDMIQLQHYMDAGETIKNLGPVTGKGINEYNPYVNPNDSLKGPFGTDPNKTYNELIQPGPKSMGKTIDLDKTISSEDDAIISKAMGTDAWSINDFKKKLKEPKFWNLLPEGITIKGMGGW